MQKYSFNYQNYLKDYNMLHNNVAVCDCPIQERVCITSDDGTISCDCEYLIWDSRVLNNNIYQISDIVYDSVLSPHILENLLKKVDSYLLEVNADLVVFRFGYDHYDYWKIFEKNNWISVDVLNIYSKTKSQSNLNESLYEEFSFRKPELEEVLVVLNGEKTLFPNARMYRDSRISTKDADDFYKNLFVSIYEKQEAIIIGIYEKENLGGFVIGCIDTNKHINLCYLWQIFIRDQYRKKGFANMLLSKFEQKVFQEYNRIEIGTQIDNYSANHLYMKNDYQLVTNAITMHKWCNEKKI